MHIICDRVGVTMSFDNLFYSSHVITFWNFDGAANFPAAEVNSFD